MNQNKETRADAKLKNLPKEDLETLWEMRYPDSEDEEAKKMTYDAIRGMLPELIGFTVSRSTLSEFYQWYKQARRMNAAKARAEQAKSQLLQQHPDASLEDLERIGQMVFTSETVADGDIKGFLGLLKINKENRKLELEERRVKLLERKAAFADEVKKTAENQEGGVTAEQMAEIEHRLKLM